MSTPVACDPGWWCDHHNLAWEKHKATLEAAWEKLPGAGKWAAAEPAVRYGFGAAQHYAGRSWDRGLELQLAAEWLGNTVHDWHRIRAAVRHGWDGARSG